MVAERRTPYCLVVGDEAVELRQGRQWVGPLEPPVDRVHHRCAGDQRWFGDQGDGVPVVDGRHLVVVKARFCTRNHDAGAADSILHAPV